ncbi:MAG: hypothetical protein NTX25_04525 [Proteobacteria bacterium]|nr:hypothetical protein [Pseudomonadota bacterium]
MKFLIEVLESFGLGICLILAAPLVLFRRLDRIFQIADHAIYLIQKGLFASLLRARLDYLMGNYQQSVVLLEPLALHLEQLIRDNKATDIRFKRLLCTLYSDMQRLFLLGGHLDNAVQIVIRAQLHLGIDRLPSNPDLDLKTARVIKAGLAASKLLEEGSLATLLVCQGEEPAVMQRESKTKHLPIQVKKDELGAKIIQFPGPQLS